MPRRVRLIVFLGVVSMLVLATGISAGAQAPGEDIATTEEEISAAQERLMEIRSEESDALADYNIALHKMNESNGEIADAEKDLQAAEEDLAEAQAALEERASQVYRSGNVGFVDVLVGVDDFSQFASRVDLWMRLLEEERAAYEAVLQAKNDIEERKSELETERARRVEAVEEALDHKDQVAASEAEAEEYLGSLNSDLQAAIEAEQQREAELARQAAEEAAKAAAAEQAAAEQAAAEQAAAEEAQRQAAEDAAAQAAAAEREAAAQAAAEQAQREAELAAEQAAEAAAAERRAQRQAERQAARQAEREEAQRQAELAAIEQAAAEQAAAEQAAAERAAERQAAREAEREEELAAQRAEERAAARAEERALEEASASAAAAEEEEKKKDEAASASASAEPKEDEASASASASASRKSSGGPSTCGDDFGGVAPHVAEAGCDLQEKFGLRVTGIGYSDYHWDGMDLDVWTSDVGLGNQVRDYAVGNYDVQYTCWQDLYVNYNEGWEESCPGHMDHVHITFN